MENHFNIKDTYQIKNNYKVYDLQKCYDYLQFLGKKTFGQSFKIYNEDKPVIFKLLIYAIRDCENALKLGLDINKGILLTGPIGCGKTSIMQLIKPFFSNNYDYKIKTTRDISFEFAKNGFDALKIFTQNSNEQNRLTGYCFDDLGTEKQIKHFGNDCNVMAEILISRYEQFIENNSITHITTNLSASELENYYGNRVRSRLRNMFNLIAFERNSCDKR